jgi:putative transposase
MPNHFHLVAWPLADGQLSRWMHWLLSSHVRRYHLRYGTSGRIWQGRFKAFPIQQDSHLIAVLRYVERNPLRAGLVPRAEGWAWSSLRYFHAIAKPRFLHPGPIDRSDDWIILVNRPQTEEELNRVRQAANRESPFGNEEWRWATANRLGLQWTLRRRGRPSTVDKESVPITIQASLLE